MNNPVTKIHVHRFGQCVGIAFAPFSTDKQTEYIPVGMLPELIRVLKLVEHDIDTRPARDSKFCTAIITAL